MNLNFAPSLWEFMVGNSEKKWGKNDNKNSRCFLLSFLIPSLAHVKLTHYFF